MIVTTTTTTTTEIIVLVELGGLQREVGGRFAAEIGNVFLEYAVQGTDVHFGDDRDLLWVNHGVIGWVNEDYRVCGLMKMMG